MVSQGRTAAQTAGRPTGPAAHAGPWCLPPPPPLAAQPSGHRQILPLPDAVVALTAGQPPQGPVSSGTWSWCRSPQDGPCLASQPRGLPYPAELHTDGAFPPFSRASSPQKLASPTFQVPFWYTATPD